MEKTVYNGNYIQVKELNIKGHTWEKAYFPDSLVIFPITKENEIILVEEKRPHEDNNIIQKFVTGHIDSNETPIECANRELQEEAGYKANKLTEILVHRSKGTINSNFYYILAEQLEESKLPNPDGEDTIVGIKKIKISELKKLLEEEKIPWTLPVLGLFKIFQKYNF